MLEDQYSKDMTIDEGVALAIHALHAAMRRDSASGEGMEVMVITKEKQEEISGEKIDEIRSSFN